MAFAAQDAAEGANEFDAWILTGNLYGFHKSMQLPATKKQLMVVAADVEAEDGSVETTKQDFIAILKTEC